MSMSTLGGSVDLELPVQPCVRSWRTPRVVYNIQPVLMSAPIDSCTPANQGERR